MPDDQKDIDRYVKDIDRFIKDIDRYLKDIDRGPKDIDRSADGIVGDVFRQISGLGGFFVVSFVAPVPASAQGPRGGQGARRLAVTGTARKAEARNQEAAVQEQPDENMLQLLGDFLKYRAQQQAKPKKP